VSADAASFQRFVKKPSSDLPSQSVCTVSPRRFRLDRTTGEPVARIRRAFPSRKPSSILLRQAASMGLCGQPREWILQHSWSASTIANLNIPIFIRRRVKLSGRHLGSEVRTNRVPTKAQRTAHLVVPRSDHGVEDSAIPARDLETGSLLRCV
jgi:hypothetical protein